MVALLDASGKVIATATVTGIKAPLDYEPKIVEISLNAPAGTKLSGCSVVIDPDKKITEITRRNNTVRIP